MIAALCREPLRPIHGTVTSRKRHVPRAFLATAMSRAWRRPRFTCARACSKSAENTPLPRIASRIPDIVVAANRSWHVACNGSLLLIA